MRLVETFGCANTDPQISITDRCLALSHLPPLIDWRARRYRNFRS
jgi:hypothetical protein